MSKRLMSVAPLCLLLASTGAAAPSSAPGPDARLAAAAAAARPNVFTPAADAAVPPAELQDSDYRIGPGDKLNVVVFELKDLNLDKAEVDATGKIAMPLIGDVQVGGRTTAEVSKEITRRLSERYLNDPHVSVLVEEAASQKVTVDGSVTQPGVYEMHGRTTLLQAVAMGKGPDKNADLRNVLVFREVGGRRMAAKFDVRAIRDGKTADPEILGGDEVVVPGSSMKTAWHELITALPAFAIFAWI